MYTFKSALHPDKLARMHKHTLKQTETHKTVKQY